MSEARTAPTLQLKASEFFVVRSPLLAISDIQAWSALGEAARAECAGTEETEKVVRRVLRAELERIICRPDVLEALCIASPDLVASLPHWRSDAKDERAKRTERALVKYVTRMATRSTPFGIFAATGYGTVSGSTQFSGIDSPRRRVARLDMSYLEALAAGILSSSDVRTRCVYHVNTSLNVIGDRVYYIQTRRNEGQRTHDTAAAQLTSELACVLECAHRIATFDALAQTLVDTGVCRADAEAFVNELVDEGVLVSNIEPCLTSADPLVDIIIQAQRASAPCEASLREVHAQLGMINRAPLGLDRKAYAALFDALDQLPVRESVQNRLQIDTVIESEVNLSNAVVGELTRVGEFLLSLHSPNVTTLSGFVQAFLDRYDKRAIPLLEVIDQDIGIGLPHDAPTIDGVARQSRWEAKLAELVFNAASGGDGTIHITDSDIATFASSGASRCPPGLALVFALRNGPYPETVDSAYDLVVSHAMTPSAAAWFGRFCHADPRLASAVRDQLSRESEGEPDAIHAEIVHLPSGRAGNVLCRPTLRQFEIPVLSRSGAEAEDIIALADLVVSIRDGRVVLHSLKHGREVVPSLTSAHNVNVGGGLAIYRFLASLRNQGYSQTIAWQWGALAERSHLPRVMYGRALIARAQWRFPTTLLSVISALGDASRHRALLELRQKTNLPQYVQLAEADNVLFCDLQNPLHVDALLDVAKKHSVITLSEVAPLPWEYASKTDAGTFAHELVMPFVGIKRTTSPLSDTSSRNTLLYHATRERTFVPGSEWLYIKLYGGVNVADSVLKNVISPVVSQLKATNAIDGFFFIRYADPRPHLRLRVHGCAARLLSEVVPALHFAARQYVAEKRLYDVQLATYEQEVERYEGPNGVRLAEAFFSEDSVAVLDLIAAYPDATERAGRRLLLLRGIHDVFTVFGYNIDQRLRAVERTRRVATSVHRMHSARYRLERSGIEDALSQHPRSRAECEGHEILRERVTRLADVAARISREVFAAIPQKNQVEYILSLTHMFANRLMIDEQPAEELSAYAMLDRFYSGVRARESGHAVAGVPPTSLRADIDSVRTASSE